MTKMTASRIEYAIVTYNVKKKFLAHHSPLSGQKIATRG